MKNILLTISILLAFSCMRPTALDPKEEPEVVVNCVLQYPHEEQELVLSWTTAPGGSAGAFITEGDVSLYDLTSGEEAGSFHYAGDGRWRLPRQLVPGNRYRLNVRIPHHDAIEAETTLPNAYTLKNLLILRTYNTVSSSSYSIALGTHYDLQSLGQETVWIAFLESPGQSVLHTTKQIVVDTRACDPFNTLGELAESVPGGRYKYAKVNGYPYHAKWIRMEKPGSFRRKDDDWGSGSKETFVYDIITERSSQIQVYPGENYGVYYQDEDFEVDSIGPGIAPQDGPGRVVFMTVSEEYDQYMKEVYVYRNRERTEGLLFRYDRTNVYSNIVGGHGIFGAAISYYMPWFSGTWDDLKNKPEWENTAFWE